MHHLARASRSLVVRLVVTLGLLTAIAFRIDWRAAARRLGDGDWSWFAFAVALLLCSQLMGAVRWQLLLRAAGIQARWLHVLRAYTIGLFSNNFLPTSFGGDFVRAWMVARSGPKLVRALTSVAVDRSTSVLCLVIVSWLAVAANPEPVPGSLILALLGVTVGGSLIGGLVLLVALRGNHGLSSRLPQRVGSWVREICGTLRLYVRQPRLFGAATVLGIAFQALGATAVWAVAWAIGLHLPYSLVAVAAPLILVITLIPISVAGFGVREGGTVLVFGAAGIGATDATLLSLIGVLVVVISTLPGAVAMLTSTSAPLPPANILSESL